MKTKALGGMRAHGGGGSAGIRSLDGNDQKPSGKKDPSRNRKGEAVTVGELFARDMKGGVFLGKGNDVLPKGRQLGGKECQAGLLLRGGGLGRGIF